MTSIEIEPSGGSERIVIRREPSPAESDAATVGTIGSNNEGHSTKTILIIPDAAEDRRKRKERAISTRSESPASDKADTGQGNRWPSTQEVIRLSQRKVQQRSEPSSNARTRTRSLSIDRPQQESKRRSKDTEAWIREQNENAQRSLRESQMPSWHVPLPLGWEARLTNEQPPRVYFVSHITKSTTWDDPRLQHRVL